MSEDLKEKLKSYRFWVSLASAVLLLVQAIGGPLGLTVDEETYMSIVNSALGVFVVLGIISHPAQNLFSKDKDAVTGTVNTDTENKAEITNADKGNETEAAKTNTKVVKTENLEGESAETDANETNSLKTESAKTLDNSSTAKVLNNSSGAKPVESANLMENLYTETPMESANLVENLSTREPMESTKNTEQQSTTNNSMSSENQIVSTGQTLTNEKFLEIKNKILNQN